MRIQAWTAAAVVALAVTGCGAADKAPAASPTTGTTISATSSAPATTSSSPAAPASGSSSALPGTAFTAYGVHTAWRAVVNQGVLTTEGTAVGERSAKVTSSAFAKGVDFSGTQAGTKVELTVRSGTCVDASGEDTGMTAVLRVGAKEYRGCAVEGAIPHADT
ncbi:MAG: hypothetical protein IPI32_12780 [Austwickia sp.]|jgi:uncharacterized membrane protein|nr:hypothetical protein [Austwickia sp.]MBK8435108.1 hypothetical protein [Austwickia sp.]MBK9101339.1 hypothetical protein [Austwickia sp.]